MSRLDWFTIAVVGICLAAIIFLLSRAMNWGSLTGEDGEKTELVEDLENAGLLDDDTIDPGNMDSDLTGDSEGIDGINAGETVGTDADASTTDADADGADATDGNGDAASNGENEAGDGSSDYDEGNGLDEDATVNTSPSRAGGDYLVIGGSFSLMHNAENFASKLKKKGYSNAYVAKFNSGKFASVIVDAFDSSSEASAMVKELKGAGIEAFSKRRR